MPASARSRKNLPRARTPAAWEVGTDAAEEDVVVVGDEGVEMEVIRGGPWGGWQVEDRERYQMTTADLETTRGKEQEKEERGA